MKFYFPSSWNNITIDQCWLGTKVIKGGTDSYVQVKYSAEFTHDSRIPMCIPCIWNTGGSWGYFTYCISMSTKTGCNINIHNLDTNDITLYIGCIVVG